MSLDCYDKDLWHLPSPWPQLLLSEKAWMSHSELCSFTDNIHSTREQGKQFTGRMVAGDIQRLSEGKHHLRRLSKTAHPDQRALPGGRKKLQVIICVLLVELCERFTFFGIVCNMILFCTVKLGYDNYLAATVNLCFIGASTLTPVLVDWFAETCLGRTKVLYLCAFLHFFGTAMLPVVAFPFEDFYIDIHHMSHKLEPQEQQALFYTGLLAAALGIGGIRAILCPLGAYNLQSYNQYQLLGFFNWFYWLVNLNSTVVFLGIAYIQQSVAKNLAFLIPFTSALLALIAIHMMRNKLTYKPKKGGSLLTTLGVFLNSLKMCCLHYRHLSGDVPSWLDRAKENNGGRYSETHVENVKVLAKLFPLYGLQLIYRACVTQIPSGYYLQAMNSNLHLSDVLLPIGTMNVISILPLLMLAPLIECVNSCSLSMAKTPLAPTRVITLGHACAALSILVAGLCELRRKSFPLVEQTLSGKVLQVSSMPCFQLAPQYILLGLAEALVTPACSLISFQLTPGHIRGISLHFLTLSYGGGCFVGAICIQVVYFMSGGSFYPSVLHDGNLERFFFFMAMLMTINTLVYWSISHRYMDLSVRGKPLTISPLTEKLLQYKACLRYYDTMDRSYTNISCESVI
ncbi:solute carrier family 15 member 5 isoform X2 [Hippocampus comes]|uniref:solute carrier family 15 member 5 isoform X2 n=1 Tax=Hippocampus comes TaxID=109280 RepID=UPI00094EFE1E|nr:PREDICTED: solute carrier family 15 member 5 isoform X2 [Hippocampus comes]